MHEPALLPGKAIVRPPLPVGRDNFRAGLLICRSEEAIGTFIAHCDIAARDLLLPYGDLVIVLSTVLRIKRTLDGAEIDKIISDVEAGKALAMEQRRRADRRQRELAASCLRAECDHCHGLDQIRCGSRQHRKARRRYAAG